jgi:hypothetical protein
MLSAIFEPTIPATMLLQTYALDRAAVRIGSLCSKAYTAVSVASDMQTTSTEGLQTETYLNCKSKVTYSNTIIL